MPGGRLVKENVPSAAEVVWRWTPFASVSTKTISGLRAVEPAQDAVRVEVEVLGAGHEAGAGSLGGLVAEEEARQRSDRPSPSPRTFRAAAGRSG